MRSVDDVSGLVVDAAYRIHKDIGPGLLESAYERLLTNRLERAGLKVDHQKYLSFEYDGIRYEEAFRVDLLVDEQVIVELKSVEKVAPVHAKQLLTYLRLSNLRVGLLVNFGTPDYQQLIKRVVNHYQTHRLDPLPLPPR